MGFSEVDKREGWFGEADGRDGGSWDGVMRDCDVRD